MTVNSGNIPVASFGENNLKELFDLYYKPLCRFAAGYVKDADTTEEIVQQVFINLWEQRQAIDPEKQIKSYLFTSVKNRCLNHIRDNKKFRNYFLDVEVELEIPVAFADKMALSDVESQIAAALDKLPEKCREVFVLCRFEDKKYKDVADELGISVKTVEAQMSKALRILRMELGDVWILIFFYHWISLN